MKSRIHAIIAVIGLLAASCTDKVTPPVAPPTPYNIYAAGMDYSKWPNERYGQFYVYDADSLTLLDTIPLPDNLLPWTAVVSSEGRWLYAGCQREIAPIGGFIVKIDLTADTLVWIKRRTGDERLRLLEEDQIICAFPDLYDAVTGEPAGKVSFDTTLGLVLGSGPLVDREMAAITFDSTTGARNVLIALNPFTGRTRGWLVPTVRIGDGDWPVPPVVTRLHPDGRRVLVVGGTPSIGAWFVVGDLITGDVLFTSPVSHDWSEIDINEEGTLASVAVYADWVFGQGSPGVYLFDLVNYRQLRHYGAAELYEWPAQVRFIPGTTRIAVHGIPHSMGGGWLQVFDIQSAGPSTPAGWPFNEPVPGGLAIGPRPQP